MLGQGGREGGLLQETAQMKAKKLGVNEMHQKEVIQNQVTELEVFLEGM